MWHRLSVHVKRQEAGSNQTAVIKPLTNTYHDTGLEFSDLSTKTLYNVAEEDESEPVRYNPPVSPRLIAHRYSPVTKPVKETCTKQEFYTPEQPLPQKCILSQQVIADNFQDATTELNSSITDLDDIINLPEPRSGVMPPYRPLILQTQQVLPMQLNVYSKQPDTLLEEEEDMENEQFGLLHGYMYNNTQIHDDEELVQIKQAMEDSLALMPPSPFRDLVGSGHPIPNSPVSENILCTPPNVTYASVILRDYKQSSSTL